MDLICLGDNVADYYLDQGIIYPGGSTYNVAILARRYGLKTAYLGPMGDDLAGQHLLQVLAQERVDASRVRVLKGRNAYSHVKLIAGERIFTKIDKGIYQEIFLSPADLAYIEGFDLLHTTVYSYTEKYLAAFKKMGLSISFDFSFKTDPAYLQKVAPWVRLAFFSAAGVQGEQHDFLKQVAEYGPEYVVLTRGEKGSLLWHQGEFYQQEAEQVKILDTLGAGDAFIARFLTGWSKKLPLPTVLKEASKAAAAACSYYGGVGHGMKVSQG